MLAMYFLKYLAANEPWRRLTYGKVDFEYARN